MIKVIFWDKDGVINENVNGTPKTVEEVILKPNIELATAILNDMGYFNVIVTNQPDVERGLVSKESVMSILNYIKGKLPIHKIVVCPNADDNSPNKKPNIGMIKQIEQENMVSLVDSFIVGDTWRDIEAGIRAGCKTIYVKQKHNYDPEVAKKADYVVNDVIEVVNIVISENYQRSYFDAVFKAALTFRDDVKLSELVKAISKVKAQNGRMFFIGAGGGAGNSSHAVCDFRKLVGIESYSATDNVSELTARVNDDGWENVFTGWLEKSHLTDKDAIFVLSVGGGDEEKNISKNIVKAIQYTKLIGAKVFGIVGLKEGYTYKNGDCVVHVPAIFPKCITPLTESFQSVILHMLATHPDLQENKTVW